MADINLGEIHDPRTSFAPLALAYLVGVAAAVAFWGKLVPSIQWYGVVFVAQNFLLPAVVATLVFVRLRGRASLATVGLLSVWGMASILIAELVGFLFALGAESSATGGGGLLAWVPSELSGVVSGLFLFTGIAGLLSLDYALASEFDGAAAIAVVLAAPVVLAVGLLLVLAI